MNLNNFKCAIVQNAYNTFYFYFLNKAAARAAPICLSKAFVRCFFNFLLKLLHHRNYCLRLQCNRNNVDSR